MYLQVEPILCYFGLRIEKVTLPAASTPWMPEQKDPGVETKSLFDKVELIKLSTNKGACQEGECQAVVHPLTELPAVPNFSAPRCFLKNGVIA